MKLKSLRIENFKALRHFEATGLGDFVLIAGPNGSGKSCVLDAVRILKSYCGGYVNNELEQLFGEFQMNPRGFEALRPMFRDPALEVSVSASFSLASSEIEYLSTHAEQHLRLILWRENLSLQRGDSAYIHEQLLINAAQRPELAISIENQARSMLSIILAQLKIADHTATFVIPPDRSPIVQCPELLKLVFSIFEPESIGIIDYHSAVRNYGREAVGGISVTPGYAPTLRGETSLYNTGAKYQNIKAEMVNAYFRDLLRKELGMTLSDETTSLNVTLTELFESFFPGKVYSGIRFTSAGVPEFPVLVGGAIEHDLNELSSGEKEVLFGYLRLRTSTPNHSIVMIDEPELHLNPALLHNFPAFYRQHVGRLGLNQLILVTHADSLLRSVIGKPEYQMFHLSPASATTPGLNQATVVDGTEDLERAVIALIGDMATYRPSSAVVILEGGEIATPSDLGFDVSLVRLLFPNFANKVNLISGTDRTRVGSLLSLLSRVGAESPSKQKYFAIVDNDTTPPEVPAELLGHLLTWGVYHIENFLLDESRIAQIANSFTMDPKSRVSAGDVQELLENAAADLVDDLAFSHVGGVLNSQILKAIRIQGGKEPGPPAQVLGRRLKDSFSKLNQVSQILAEDEVERLLAAELATLRTSLSDGSWRSKFPGRLLLKSVFSRLTPAISYENFRNLLINQMADDNFQPPGMQKILTKIVPF